MVNGWFIYDLRLSIYDWRFTIGGFSAAPIETTSPQFKNNLPLVEDWKGSANCPLRLRTWFEVGYDVALRLLTDHLREMGKRGL
jgi:hypothetical protein